MLPRFLFFEPILPGIYRARLSAVNNPLHAKSTKSVDITARGFEGIDRSGPHIL